MPLKKWQPPPPTGGPEKVEGGSIVLLGNFNPAIFQPLWFSNQDLIPKSEAEAAEIQVVHSEVTSFSLEWLGLQVTKNRFTASTSDSAHLEPLRDLVLGTFSILEHTPLLQMGMNRDVHYKLPSHHDLLDVGNRLAAKSFWRHIIDDPRPEVLRLAGRRPDVEDALLRLTVEPSARVIPGMYFGFNEHYQAEGDNPTRELLMALSERWRQYQVWAKETAEHLLADLTGKLT